MGIKDNAKTDMVFDKHSGVIKDAFQLFKQNEDDFRMLIEQCPFAIEILTSKGQIIKVNDAWQRLWGLNEKDTAQVLSKYNMLTDKQVVELGILSYVKKAFSGDSVILPPIQYNGDLLMNEIGLGHLKTNAPWIQCYLYSVKNKKEEIAYVVNMYIDITETKQAELRLRSSLKEIEDLKKKLEAERDYLQNEIRLEQHFETIIGQSEALKYVLSRVELVASMDSSVLIMGETGTGKELIAQALHRLSPRGRSAMVKVNCATLPRELIESELFGREKGAFTGATKTQLGRFELAQGSTLFLDEIGELPYDLQAKLLRVLESGEFERLGSSKTLCTNARIIAATNRILEDEVKKGRFRQDLWYRLKVFPITVPALRERPDDIPLLIHYFVNQFARKMDIDNPTIPKKTMDRLLRYNWPGNVRELKHAVENAMVSARAGKLTFELPRISEISPTRFKTFEQMERNYILKVLKAHKWKIGGKNSTASTLDLHVNTLRSKMKKLGIKHPGPKNDL